MDKRLVIGLAIAAIFILLLPAFAAPNHEAALKRVEQNVVLAGYQSLSEQAISLHQSIGAYCSNDAASDAALKPAFHAVMSAWQAVQHIRHGPVAQSDRHSRIQFWPDKRAKTGKHLRKFLATGTPDDLASETFENKSVAIQGLQTLERLLFTENTLFRTPVDGQALSPCAVATAISMNIETIGRNILSEGNSSTGNTDPKSALRAHVTDLITGLEVVSHIKLLEPVGKDRTRPKLAENWRSARSFQNVRINLQALRNYYTAIIGTDLNEDPDNQQIINQFDEIIERAKPMDNSMVSMLESDAGIAQLRYLVILIQDLREMMIVKLTSHLGINLGFNSLDGD